MLKKIIFLSILLVFVNTYLKAEIHGHFEIGKTIENEWAKTEIELQWWIGKGIIKNELYGGWQTWFIPHNLRGAPFKDVYFLGDRIHFRNFYLELEHFCNHPVYSYYNRSWWNDNISNKGSLTTVSIGIKW